MAEKLSLWDLCRFGALVMSVFYAAVALIDFFTSRKINCIVSAKEKKLSLHQACSCQGSLLCLL